MCIPTSWPFRKSILHEKQHICMAWGPNIIHILVRSYLELFKFVLGYSLKGNPALNNTHHLFRKSYLYYRCSNLLQGLTLCSVILSASCWFMFLVWWFTDTEKIDDAQYLISYILNDYRNLTLSFCQTFLLNEITVHLYFLCLDLNYGSLRRIDIFKQMNELSTSAHSQSRYPSNQNSQK